MDNKKSPKISKIFVCELCDFECSKQSEWNIHITRRKHLVNVGNDNNDNEKTPKISKAYQCSKCSNIYKYSSGLSRHKQYCNIKNEEETNIHTLCHNAPNQGPSGLLETSSINKILIINESGNLNNNKITNNELINNNIINTISNKHDEDIKLLTNLIVEVVKNNNEFQKQMFDLIKNTNNINMNNCNNNSNNQTFNLQLFLNETCKDAMNMSDFINSFDINYNDLERLADDGYVKTMSNMIIDKVRELDVEKRPIHCSDARREVVFIKEDDVWLQDDEEKSILRKAINKLGSKNIGVLHKWHQNHPDSSDYNSPNNTLYLKMMIEAMGGRDIRKNEDKIMKKIISEVVIEKKNYLS